jgi:cytochrome P450
MVFSYRKRIVGTVDPTRRHSVTTDIVGARAPCVFDADLPTLPYFDSEYQEHPHRLNRQARHQGPVAMGPLGPEVLSYAEVHTVLRDRRFHMPGGLALEAQGITSGPLWERAVKSILSLDGDEHNRLRRLVSRAFTPSRADHLRTRMTEVIDDLIDQVAASGHCDVVADIARGYPIQIICELLGAPGQDWQLFSAWTEDIFKIFNFNAVNDAPLILRAFDELDAYIDRMASERQYALTDDLISSLIQAENDGDRLSHAELMMLVGAVLTGGTDTTRNQLAAAIQVFCDHPDQWALLAKRPELAPGTVEEVLRHTPIILRTIRKTAEDVEVAGVRIPAGTLVGANTAAANRDPAAYDDPDRFDITRHGPAPMLTFGGGIHYCLGVHLAKAELAEALVVMARRMPNLRRVGPAPWKPVIGVSGPITVPVEFDSGH